MHRMNSRGEVMMVMTGKIPNHSRPVDAAVGEAGQQWEVMSGQDRGRIIMFVTFIPEMHWY